MSIELKRVQRLWYSALLFPLCLLLFVIVMTVLNLSGSSVGVYGVSSGQTAEESGVVAGVVRPVRSDEWLVRTPWLMSQIHRGLATETKSGLGPLDAGVVGDLPTRSFDLLVRPHHVTSWFLSPDRALAAEWWFWHLLMISGVYTLVIAVSRHRAAAVLASLVLVLSPSTQWWVAPGTFTTVGYGTLTGGLIVLAIESRGPRRQIGLSLLVGWSAACTVSTLYLPWIITTAIVVCSAIFPVICHKLTSARNRKSQIIAVGRIVGVAGTVFIILLASYVLRHREAIETIRETVYPGQRVNEHGGTLSPATVFGAPFEYLAYGPQLVNINGTNQSENSSGVLFALPIAVAVFGLLAAGQRFWPNREGRVLAGLLVSSAILVAWALLPLPTSVGRFMLLNHVPPSRLPPGLSLASTLTLGVFVSYLRNNLIIIRTSVRIVAVIVFAFVQLWAAGLYRVELNAISLWKPSLVILILSTGFVFVTGNRWRVGIIVLVVFGLVQAANINPLQRGAESLLDNSVSQLIKRVESSGSKSSGWLLLGGDVYVRGVIEATGVNFVSGVSRYPNHKTWEKLDPSLQYVDVWNRFAHLFFFPGLPGSMPQVELLGGDALQVVLDPCDGRLSAIGVTKVVTQDYVLSNCGALIGETNWGSRVVRVYSL